MRGLVIKSSNNIYTVRCVDGRELECRIKGKVLKSEKVFYNPLASGDQVEFTEEGSSPGQALITDLAERGSFFSRWNQKGESSQLMAANLDLVLCVTTPANPPFRPRFLDRLLLQADIAGLEAVIVMNKVDLVPEEAEDCDVDLEERLCDFERLGFRVLRISAATGAGLEDLRALIAGRKTALVGQSGVGKSSLLNALSPVLSLKTGEVSSKFDRGTHTTTMARLVEVSSSGGWVVDTPGIRCFIPDGVSAQNVASHLREFMPLVGKCTYGASCSHITEPGCKILEAVAAGVIHEDRYASYLNLRDELLDMDAPWKTRGR